MTSVAAPGTWSLRRVQETLGLSRRVVHGLIAAQFVQPQRGPRNQLTFSFQDLVLLRTAFGLQRARIPPRKILQALAALREELPASLHLTGLRITAEGADVVVRGADGPREAVSGQWVMDFAVVPDETGSLAVLSASAPELAVGHEGAPVSAAEGHFRRGEALEATDRAAAADAYRDALALEPGCIEAAINLGAMLCEDGACSDAVAVFASVLQHGAGDPLVHFNHAVALEDLGETQAAQASYAKALAGDPLLADAHFNLARLLRVQGDQQGALRHWSAYRRLQRERGA